MQPTSTYPDGHIVVMNGLIPSVGHLVAALHRGQPVPLAALVSHAALSKEDNHIARHVLYAVGWHAQPAFEGHQQSTCKAIAVRQALLIYLV